MRAMILLALVGCQTAPVDPVDPIVEPPDLRPVEVLPATIRIAEPSVVIDEHDLTGIPGSPTGITVEPETGRRLVLLSHGAIVELGSTEPLWNGEFPNDFGYTDVTAISPGVVALTTLSDGYLLELETGRVTPHFCYEPGWMEPEGQDPVQLASAVAHDPLAGRIYAQPRTIENGGWGATMDSFVAAYDQQGGSDLTWWTLDSTFVANGMVVLPREDANIEPTMLLGNGSTIHVFDAAEGEIRAALDLTSLGVTWIEGLALDGDSLLVLDASYRVIELRLSALELGAAVE
jgi:hypothetical protein